MGKGSQVSAIETDTNETNYRQPISEGSEENILLAAVHLCVTGKIIYTASPARERCIIQ